MASIEKRALAAAGVTLSFGSMITLHHLNFPDPTHHVGIQSIYLYATLLAGLLMCLPMMVLVGPESTNQELESKVKRMASDLKELWALNSFKSAQTESSVRAVDTKDEE
tara:strand:- start:78 stop:404 length:327 start_codon:yes stop_codon:yes gene_type:complete